MKKQMAKKAMVLSLVGLMSLGVLTGCGDKDKEKNASARKVIEYDIKDYVTLGAYTGLSVDEEITIVTDDDVQAQVDSLIQSKTTYTDITDRNIINGDKVTLNYIRSVDGEDDVNKSDYTLEIGSGSMGDEFESKLIGLALNSSLTFTIDEEVETDNVSQDGEVTSAGTTTVAATYTVTITGIQEKVVPELTDSFIAENTEYDTIDAYKAGTKTELEEQNASNAKTAAQSELLQMIIDASTISGCPAFIYNMNYNAILQSYAMYASYFGGDLDTYMTSAGVTYEDVQNDAVEMTKQTLVIEAIVKEAGVDITDEQFDENLNMYVENYGFESTDAVLETYTREELLFDMRRDAAIEYIYENNTINQTMVSED